PAPALGGRFGGIASGRSVDPPSRGGRRLPGVVSGWPADRLSSTVPEQLRTARALHRSAPSRDAAPAPHGGVLLPERSEVLSGCRPPGLPPPPPPRLRGCP